MIDKVWVINLDRSPERLVRITRRLDALGVEFERWPAIDGKTLTDVNCEAFRSSHPVYHKDRLTDDGIRGWTACTRSHQTLLQHVVDTWTGPTLILEDDAVLREDWFERVEAAVNGLGDSCEMLLLGCYDVLSLGRGGALAYGAKKARRPRLMHAYLLLTKQMAQTLANAWLDETTEADEVWWRLMGPEKPVWCLTPLAAHQERIDSDITGRQLTRASSQQLITGSGNRSQLILFSDLAQSVNRVSALLKGG